MTTPGGCTLTALFSLLSLVISSLGVSLSSLNVLPAPSQDQRIVAEDRTAANQPLAVYYETGSGLVEASRDAEGRFVVGEYGAQNGRGLYTVTVGVPPVLAQQFALGTQALYLVRCKRDGALFQAGNPLPADQGFDDMAIQGALEGGRVAFSFRYGFKVADYPWTLAIGAADTDPWNPQDYAFTLVGSAPVLIVLSGSHATAPAAASTPVPQALPTSAATPNPGAGAGVAQPPPPTQLPAEPPQTPPPPTDEPGLGGGGEEEPPPPPATETWGGGDEGGGDGDA